jgi:hypothetical protein
MGEGGRKVAQVCCRKVWKGIRGGSSSIRRADAKEK